MGRFTRVRAKPKLLTFAAAMCSFVAIAASAVAGIEEVTSEKVGFAGLVFQLSSGAAPADASRSIAVIHRRLDLFGVRNAHVLQIGHDQISVEAAGSEIPARLPALLATTGRLTFQLVDDGVNERDLAAERLPSGDVFAQSADPNCAARCSFALRREAWITGDMIVRAQQGFNPHVEQPTVQFRLDKRGTRLLAAVTNENVGKRFAVVLDGRVIQAPTIETPILGGEAEINGNFTLESANDFTLLLRSGSLPAPLIIVAERAAQAPPR